MKQSLKTQIAKNYAKALYELADTHEKKLSLLHDLELLLDFAQKDSQSSVLLNPLLKPKQQDLFIDDIAQILKLNQLSIAFFKMLIQNKRLFLINQIYQHFQSFYLEGQGIIPVEVETVQPLSGTQEKKLKEGLEKKLHKKVILSYKLNKSLLGGLILRYHSFEIDDSLKGKMMTLEKVMKG